MFAMAVALASVGCGGGASVSSGDASATTGSAPSGSSQPSRSAFCARADSMGAHAKRTEVSQRGGLLATVRDFYAALLDASPPPYIVADLTRLRDFYTSQVDGPFQEVPPDVDDASHRVDDALVKECGPAR